MSKTNLSHKLVYPQQYCPLKPFVDVEPLYEANYYYVLLKHSFAYSYFHFHKDSFYVPDDFCCPISLELMKDPVIVSTGQTYERSCIQKWLDAGHKTCPKTQQTLLYTALTPNYVLKSLIALWCESNGVDLPKKHENSSKKRYGVGGSSSECDKDAVDALLQKLANVNLEEQRAVAGELRLLAKRNADNRVCIAEAGAIPLLVDLLSSPDSRTQEHSVTALLNLSIYDANKRTIVNAGAIPDIVSLLKTVVRKHEKMRLQPFLAYQSLTRIRDILKGG